MRGEQKTGKAGCSGEGTVETESSRKARSNAALETAEKDGADEYLASIGYDDISKRYEALHLSR